MGLRLNSSYAKDFLRENDLAGLKTQVSAAHNALSGKDGLGNDFLGWISLPFDYDKEEFARIKAAVKRISVSAALI